MVKYLPASPSAPAHVNVSHSGIRSLRPRWPASAIIRAILEVTLIWLGAVPSSAAQECIRSAPSGGACAYNAGAFVQTFVLNPERYVDNTQHAYDLDLDVYEFADFLLFLNSLDAPTFDGFQSSVAALDGSDCTGAGALGSHLSYVCQVLQSVVGPVGGQPAGIDISNYLSTDWFSQIISNALAGYPASRIWNFSIGMGGFAANTDACKTAVGQAFATAFNQRGQFCVVAEPQPHNGPFAMSILLRGYSAGTVRPTSPLTFGAENMPLVALCISQQGSPGMPSSSSLAARTAHTELVDHFASLSFILPTFTGFVAVVDGMVAARDGVPSVAKTRDYVLSSCDRPEEPVTGGFPFEHIPLGNDAYQIPGFAPWSPSWGYGIFSPWKALIFALGWGELGAVDMELGAASNPTFEISDDFELRGDLYVPLDNSLRVTSQGSVSIVTTAPEGPEHIAGALGDSTRHDILVSGAMEIECDRIPPFGTKAGINASIVVGPGGEVFVRDGGVVTINAGQILQIHPGGSVTIEDGGTIVIEDDGILEVQPGASFIQQIGSALTTQTGSHILRYDIVAFANASVGSGISIPQGSEPYASTTADYNADGKEDLVVSYTDIFAQLYRNTGNQEDTAIFQNFAFQQLGNGSVGNTKGVNRIDYSNDGTVDLFFAGANGSRLFRGSPLIVGNLTQETTNLLGAAASQGSSASAWGDFDKNGFLDVYIVRDVSDVLLKPQLNWQGALVGYTDITSAVGLHADTDSTTSAMWADLDRDSWPDLFVTWGGMKSYENEQWCYYYRNLGPNAQGNFSFDDVTGQTAGPGIAAMGRAYAVDFADLNGDLWLDLILARQVPPPPGGFQNLLVCYNDGTGGLRTEPGAEFGIQPSQPITDVEVTDLDGNGVLDVLAIPTDGTAPLAYYGRLDAGVRKYWNGTAASGLGSGITYGLSTTDFNADSDPDIFLLRPESGPNEADKRFLWSNPRRTVTNPLSPGKERFLTVSLAAMANGANRLGLGAAVTVTVITPTGQTLSSTQVVDGGSGKGGQGSGRLVFGLGGASTATIRVNWPHGVSQLFPDASVLPGFPNVQVAYTLDPLINSSSITASYIPSQYSATHQFRWRTTNPGGNPEVRVTIGSPNTAACKVPLGGGTQVLLKAGVGGVTVTSVPLSGGGQEHTVTWTTYCQAVCSYTYSVRNIVGGQLYSASGGTHTVGICGGFGE